MDDHTQTAHLMHVWQELDRGDRDMVIRLAEKLNEKRAAFDRIYNGADVAHGERKLVYDGGPVTGRFSVRHPPLTEEEP